MNIPQASLHRIASTPLAESLSIGSDAASLAPSVETVARKMLQTNETANKRPKVAQRSQSSGLRSAILWLLPLLKWLATFAIGGMAILSGLVTWDYYVAAPWTRDGRVRVQVASVAPQVSGQIAEIRVADNQFVRVGEVLYVIDPVDFEMALHADRAQLQQKAADLQIKQMQSERRQRLSSLVASPEEQQNYAGAAVQAKAAFEVAQQQVAQAEINLHRTQVLSPVNGYITNLLLRVGDYARQGGANISIIDTDSFWIDGYFEETKLARICIGSQVEAKLMGYSQPILGHVAGVARGIGVSNAAAGPQGLPNVDPVYTWVRLAQRVPVHIAIDSVPPGVPLVSGTTATVTIKDAPGGNGGPWLGRTISSLEASLSDVVNGPPARPGCIPTMATERATTMTVPLVRENWTPAPEQINPGLAPSMAGSPQNY